MPKITEEEVAQMPDRTMIIYLFQGFWALLDFEPESAPVTRVVGEHVRRS